MSDKISYRVEFNREEYEELLDLIKKSRRKGIKSIIDKIEKVKIIDKKNKTTKKAIDTKIALSISKVDEAVKNIKADGKVPTLYMISKVAGISYNTAKKYYKGS